jgi:hypothetical protein
MTECPVGCGREVKRRLLMCAECWYSVPQKLRQELNRAWREFQRAYRAAQHQTPDIERTIAQYKKVRSEVIAFAKNMLKQPEARS